MDILDDMGVSKLSAKVFSKVNYSFKHAMSILSFIKSQSLQFDNRTKPGCTLFVQP